MKPRKVVVSALAFGRRAGRWLWNVLLWFEVHYEKAAATAALGAVVFLCVKLPLIVQDGQRSITKQLTVSATQSQKTLDTTAKNLDATLTSVKGSADAATNLLKATTNLTNALTTSVKSGNADIHGEMVKVQAMTAQATSLMKTTQTTIAGLQPLETSATGAVGALRATALSANTMVNNINGQVTQNAEPVHSLVVNAAGLTGNMKNITGDLSIFTDKAFNPPPCRHVGCKIRRVIWTAFPLTTKGLDAWNAWHQVTSGTQIYGTVKVR